MEPHGHTRTTLMDEAKRSLNSSQKATFFDGAREQFIDRSWSKEIGIFDFVISSLT